MAKKKSMTDLLNEAVAEELDLCVEPEQAPRTVLFPGILPDPFEPDDQVLAMGTVDLVGLRSALHLMMLQCQVCIGSIEQLEYQQRQVQEVVSKKEGKK